MKVVLSRKGFDSTNGGYPSPILPDGTLLSLPIPASGDKLSYKDLQYSPKLSYYTLMKSIKPTIRQGNEGLEPLTPSIECHLDPDLVKSTIPRLPGWNPAFGQIGAAQTHLENNAIGKGDLFLFFGWFRQTEWVDNKQTKLRFVRSAPDLHIIFGYLQIGEVLQPQKKENIPKWLHYHPHITNNERFGSRSNTLYIARNQPSWSENLAGAGTLKLGNTNILTADGKTRSFWNLPEMFESVHITYHSKKSWKSDGTFDSAKIGQEFVIDENKEITSWAQNLINNFSIHEKDQFSKAV